MAGGGEGRAHRRDHQGNRQRPATVALPAGARLRGPGQGEADGQRGECAGGQHGPRPAGRSWARPAAGDARTGHGRNAIAVCRVRRAGCRALASGQRRAAVRAAASRGAARARPSSDPSGLPRVSSAYVQRLPSVPVSDSTPMSAQQRQAAAALLATLSPVAAELGRLFARHGHDLALVGGPVRDVFLGRSPGDLDLTTDAPPERVLEITRTWADSAWLVGIAFGTVGLRKGDAIIEITTYRSERYAADSRHPEVRYGTSLEDDLLRRDFTVNAMAARLPDCELVDPSGGLGDLTAKVLRTPGRPEDSLNDDPLRILRAARFVAQLGFSPVPQLRVAMQQLAPRLAIVSAERVSAELSKLMLAPREGGPSG